jgi:hypothetical protein
MKKWTKTLAAGTMALGLAGCGTTTTELPSGDSGPVIGTQVSGPQLRNFSQQLANKLRNERFFVEAVSAMRDDLSQAPNVGFSRLENATTQDDLDMENVYYGFQEAFYTTEKVAFTRNMPNPHLKLHLRLTERRTYGDGGETLADYEARVRVMKLVLNDDPDQPAVGEKLIGSVSDTLTLKQDKLVF